MVRKRSPKIDPMSCPRCGARMRKAAGLTRCPDCGHCPNMNYMFQERRGAPGSEDESNPQVRDPSTRGWLTREIE